MPLFTPFLMVNRLPSAVPPGPAEIALTVTVLVLGVVFTMWIASRVFRVGILLYGKQPAPKEVWRWIREA